MYRLLYILLLTALAACNGHYPAREAPQLVVEGWIDEGDFPYVVITRTVPVSEEYQDVSELGQYLERWAKVTISDGEHEEVMVGRLTRSFYPPFYYTTSFMRGEAGKTYRLHVECTNGLTADAVTTIPREQAAIDSFWVEPVAFSDTLFMLHGRLDAATTARYLKVFTQTDTRLQSLQSSYMGVFSRDMVGDGTFVINRGRSNLQEDDYVSTFSINDTVHVKIAAVSEEQFAYWRSYEDVVSLSRNPLFPATDNLPSNVSSGTGYWFGYSASNYAVPIRQLVGRR